LIKYVTATIILHNLTIKSSDEEGNDNYHDGLNVSVHLVI